MHASPSLRSRLRKAAVAALMSFGALAYPCWAQTAVWPERAVRLFVPFAAGGNADIVARLIAPDLSKAFGQPVVVENKPGASGNLAAAAAAKAAPDRYTLLLGTVGTQAINPSIYRKIPYDTLNDFAPVTLIASVPNVLVVHTSNKSRSVAELVEQGRGRPLTFASSGAGSSIHLSDEMFKSMTGLDMTHVPYRGSSLALTDLMGVRSRSCSTTCRRPCPRSSPAACERWL